jgi:uncharacterized membrane protein YukC
LSEGRIDEHLGRIDEHLRIDDAVCGFQRWNSSNRRAGPEEKARGASRKRREEKAKAGIVAIAATSSPFSLPHHRPAGWSYVSGTRGLAAVAEKKKKKKKKQKQKQKQKEKEKEKEKEKQKEEKERKKEEGRRRSAG